MTDNDQEIILINVSGEDKPGLLGSLTETLAMHDALLLDIGQAIIHEELALGLLVSVAPARSGELIKSIMFRAHDVGSKVSVSRVTQTQLAHWLGASGQPRFILTLLADGRSSEPLRAVSQATHQHGFNIDSIRRLTDRGATALEAARLCVEMRVRGSTAELASLQQRLLTSSETLGFDFSLQEDTVFRRNRRLVAFDMDSTLINAEVIDELARRHGVYDQVAAITARAMAGELDFQASFRARAALLKGLSEQALAEVAAAVELNPGADRLIRALKHFGYKIAVISGGFQYVGDELKDKLGIDYVHANALSIEAGVMTGDVQGDIIDADRKALLLREIADKEGIALAQTIAIGDGANDLPMLKAAGLGVAFHAKAAVKENAKHAISNFGLDAVLYLIGFSDRDIDQALA